MSKKPAVLAIDLGTSSVKVLVAGQSGEVFGRGTQSYPVARPQPGFAEQDPELWWTATRQAVAQAMATSPAVRIESIGLSGQMHGTVLIGASGQPLRPAIIWEDTRSGAQAAEIENRFGRQRFIETTGSAAASGFQAPSLLWVQQHEPQIWDQTRHVLLPKDYLRFRLSGDFVTEPSDASSTVLLDVKLRQWSSDVLKAIHISPSQLPAIVPSDSESSRLSRVPAQELGLRPGIPIAGGAGDAPAAALASGGADPHTLVLTISSGSQAIIATNMVLPDSKGRIHSWCHCLSPETGAGWYMMAATMVSGLAMRWLSQDILALPAPEHHLQLERWSKEIAPGSAGLIFVPYLAGERTPHMDPHARGIFLGLTTSHDRRHLTRAVMEGSIFAIHQAYTVLTSKSPAPERIVLAGGGARSAAWTQIVADMFDLPVYPNQEPDGSALGAAILAGASTGWFSAQKGADNWLQVADSVAPHASATATYRQLAEVFNAAYAKHRDDFRTLERASSHTI
ncbi:xylulokinase [soil metagenome]